MITLAHISDVHLAPLPRVSPRELMSKRITGWLNWRLKRGHQLRRDTLSDLVAHMKDQSPQMVAVTGDLVNLALDAEVFRALEWLRALGEPENVCAVPGNHDAYIKGALEKALATYGDYMSGETLGEEPFPYLRRMGQVALIGVSSAIATKPFVAAGQVGAGQIERLGKLLKLLGEAGYFRVVMIHHPPNAECADSQRLGLWDAVQLRAMFAQVGAELVLHGHTHESTAHAIGGPDREIPVIGVAAGSAAPGGHEAPGRYNLFRIEQVGNQWTCNMREFGYQRIGDDITMRLQMRIY